MQTAEFARKEDKVVQLQHKACKLKQLEMSAEMYHLNHHPKKSLYSFMFNKLFNESTSGLTNPCNPGVCRTQFLPEK